MEKSKKWIYFLGSLAIGMIAAIAVLLVLTISGVLDGGKIKLTLVSGSEEFQYDGTAHTYEIYELKAGKLQNGHKISAVFTGNRTEVGKSENTFTVSIKDEGGADVTSQYTLQYTFGEITITPRPVSVSTASGTKVYDGTALSCPDWEIVSETKLLEGHTVAKAVLPAQRTDVGVSENYVSEFSVTDGVRDVTGNYVFTFYPGELTVTPRRLTVRSFSATKDFDGTPLTCGEWEIVSVTKPLDGHRVEVGITGERTEVGESENTISEVRVMSGGTDVTHNYDIKLQEGSLIVKGDGGGAQTGGSSLNRGGAIGASPVLGGEDPRAAEIYSEQEGKIYLRLMSFGDYNGAGWNPAEDCGMTLAGGYGMNYLMGIALQNAGYTSIPIRIRSFGQDYLLPYYPDTFVSDYTIQPGDVAYIGDTSSVYSLYFYSYDALSEEIIDPDLGAYSAQEMLYRQYVKDRYLAVPDETREFFNSVIREQGIEGDKTALIRKAAEYIRNAARYNSDYDKTLDEKSDIVISFLRDYKEGICQHFASAAVLLFRTLGIPARYTIGYAADVFANTWTEIGSENAHAWAEVYVDGVGWIQVEVSGNAQSGTQTGTGGKTFVVRPVNEYMKYDGVNTLYPSGQVQGISDLISRGFRYEAKISGSRRDVGISSSYIESFSLFDPGGNDVTDTYEIVFKTGKLQVYLVEITVTTEGESKIYDGKPLVNGEYALNGRLLYNHRLKLLNVTGSRLNVGRSLNTFEIKIVDEFNKDVTNYYKINAVCGVLEVLAREITVTAGSAEKIFDGEPLVSDAYMILPEINALADGQKITVRTVGSQTEIGRSDNVIAEIVIYDENGNDVTGNYTVILKNGILNVIA